MKLSPRALGWSLVVFAALSGSLAALQLRVPVFKIPQLAGEEFGGLLVALARLFGASGNWVQSPAALQGGISWAVVGIVVAVGLWLGICRGSHWNLTPLARKQIIRFRAIRRGYAALCILAGLVFIASLDNLVVGNRALVVRYNDQLLFPFVRAGIPGKYFGLAYESETDYRELKRQFIREGGKNWVIMPPVPYAAQLDAPTVEEQLEKRGGLFHRAGEAAPFNGRAYSVFAAKPSQKRQEWAIRRGLLHGDMRGWDLEGEQVEKGRFENGKRVAYEDLSDGKAASLETQASPEITTIIYPPSSPSWRHRHFLGTNTAGNDVFAVLFGGWQRSIYAVVFYLTVTLLIGVFVGGTLGYFGGWYDLLGVRAIEVWSTLPFLFIVMIVSSVVQPQQSLLVLIICLFSWIGPTLYMRTATYRERSRDYVAATQLLGASTARVLFRHILPNTIAVLVTLAPFMVAGIITSLAALDFLGFGLPPEEPSWGRLLHEGTENFNYPWIVSSAFVAMTFVLVLVTFVGEAVREAFDPKKFTTYQ